MDDFLSTSTLEDIVNLLIRLVELAGAIVIFTGAVLAFFRFVLQVVRYRDGAGFSLLRLGLGRYLILGLEFQLASDILRTAVSPTFEDLLLLLLVAGIRTALNYVLRLEMRDEAVEVARLMPPGASAATALVATAHAMTALTFASAAVLTIAALVVTVVGGLRTGRWRASADLGLRFLLGAGLLALTGHPDWWTVLVVALLVALEALSHRRILARGIRARRRRPAGSTPS